MLYLHHGDVDYLKLGSEWDETKKRLDEPSSKPLFALPLNMYGDAQRIVDKVIISTKIETESEPASSHVHQVKNIFHNN